MPAKLENIEYNDPQSGMANKAASRKTQFYVLLVLLWFVFFTGGASRADVLSVMILRPVSVLILGYAVWARIRVKPVAKETLLKFLLGFVALHIIQLAPLPQFIWSNFPGRHAFVSLGADMDMPNIVRPLTLSPAATLNSLFSLAVPLAGCLLTGAVTSADRVRLLRALILATAVSCVMGMLQIAGGTDEGFYLYQVTNVGVAVGLFANRNHQALLIACAIILAAWSIRERMPLRHQAWDVAGCTFDAALIAVALVLLMEIGSRAGLLFGAIGLIVAAGIALWPSTPVTAGHRQPDRKGLIKRMRGYVPALAGLVIFGIIALTVAMSRDASLERFGHVSQGDEIRREALPILFDMVKSYFPAGSGFGTFQYAYRIVEPENTLSPIYLNEAHNDWLQIIIEGGIGSAILLAVFLLWMITTMIKANQLAWEKRDPMPPALTILIIFFGCSSAVDYPLRVPSLMLIFVILLQILSNAVVQPDDQGRRVSSDRSRFTGAI